MIKVNRIASAKQKLDMVLLCIPNQFGLVKFEFVNFSVFCFKLGLVSGCLVLFVVVKFGFDWLS